MHKSITYCIWILCCIYTPPLFPSLVFVHLGNNTPSCLPIILKQARTLNPDQEIYLLTNTSSSHYADLYQKEHILQVHTSDILLSEEHMAFTIKHRFDPLLSEGLWLYAVERFFVLYDFLLDKNLENIFHLESDCMLYVNTEELLPVFQEKNVDLAAPFQSRAGCIPCFVFIKNRESLKKLIDHMLLQIDFYTGNAPHNRVNDMVLLSDFYAKSPQNLTPLPTLMPEYLLHAKQRKSLHPEDNATTLDFLTLHSSWFDRVLFDAATLGVYVNGNHRMFFHKSGPGTTHYRSLFFPQVFTFFWENNTQGIPVPRLSFLGKKYKIVNLHFHSKMPENFTSYAPYRHEFFNHQK